MQEEEDGDFYTPGPEKLYDVRVAVARTSLEAAAVRLQREYDAWESFDEVETLKQKRTYYERVRACAALEGTQSVSQRFTSCAAYAPNGDLAVGAWDGAVYVLDSLLKVQNTLQFGSKVSALAYVGDTIAVGGFEPSITIFGSANDAVQGEDILSSTLSGHLQRVSALQTHPHHSLLFSASHDETWRAWDLTTGTELYYQEGHVGPLHTLDVHPDGSLLASAASDGFVKLWDLRSGKLVADLVQGGHVGSIHTVKFRTSGTQLVSGGADHNVVVWDLRKTAPLTHLPLHTGLVSDVGFTNDDQCLVTCSYDGSLKLTQADSWGPLANFPSLDKAMGFATRNNTLVSVGWGGNVKLYTI